MYCVQISLPSGWKRWRLRARQDRPAPKLRRRRLTTHWRDFGILDMRWWERGRTKRRCWASKAKPNTSFVGRFWVSKAGPKTSFLATHTCPTAIWPPLWPTATQWPTVSACTLLRHDLLALMNCSPRWHNSQSTGRLQGISNRTATDNEFIYSFPEQRLWALYYIDLYIYIYNIFAHVSVYIYILEHSMLESDEKQKN